jgi:N-acetylneuraminate lyase
VELSRHAKAHGADAVSAVPPFFFKYSFEEIIRYYLDIVEASSMPLILYNIPMFSGISFTHANSRVLFEHPLIVGIKHTAQDLYALERIRSAYPSLLIFNGFDEVFLAGLSMGANALIGSTANFMAQKFIRIKELFDQGKISEAMQVQNSVNEIVEVFAEVGVFRAVKYAVSLMGFECGNCRRPFLPLAEKQKTLIRDVLKKLSEREA